MPKHIVIMFLIIMPSHKLMALEFNTDSTDDQPITISCEKYPRVECGNESNNQTILNDSSGIEVIPIEANVEATNPTTEEEPYVAPQATYNYAVNSRLLNRLRTVAGKFDCVPVWDLPGVDLNLGPWHVDISDMTGNQNDYIFICRSKAKKYKFNVIVVADLNRKIWKGCPSEVYAGTTIPYPSGLAVDTSDNSSDPVIDTSRYDLGDSGIRLTCHKGKWNGYLAH